ncbi:hypothetical protein IK5_05876 [Bacillus cereus VD154]|uniref:Uncharacterized protein n=1 Tax=Bacillus cereus VD154 TaxID=1053238 RepID=A0A9W5KR90_BACCE|nr:hypothetical protein IK5_05876 [Bacillus cereus VD154]
MEALPTRYNFISCTLVPTVQFKFSRFGGNHGRKGIILSSYNELCAESINTDRNWINVSDVILNKQMIRGEWMKRILK